MWQSQSHKDKKGSGKRRDPLRNLIHIKRINADITTTENGKELGEHFKVRLMLNNLSPEGGELFCPSSLLPGQEFTINIEKPTKFQTVAKVSWCEEFHPESHILSDQPFTYRMGIEFRAKDDVEKQAIATFCEYIRANYLMRAAA